MTQFTRAVSKYLFTKEVADCVESYIEENTEDSQFSAVHYVTPTGQDVGRVFVCGTLTQVEDIGDNDPYFKARLVDPTGAISVYAGQYQPDAAKALENIEIPIHVAVVGKINLFEIEDGSVISSIRAESVNEVDEDTIRTWTFMAARNLIEHIKKGGEPKAMKIAAEAYGGATVSVYKELAVTALNTLLPESSE